MEIVKRAIPVYREVFMEKKWKTVLGEKSYAKFIKLKQETCLYPVSGIADCRK